MAASLTRVSTMTLPEELRMAPGQMIRWLLSVARPEPSRFNAWRRRGETHKKLQLELEAIETSWMETQTQAESFRAFLDRVEHERAGPVPDEAAMNRFLDRVESRPPFSIGGEGVAR